MGKFLEAMSSKMNFKTGRNFLRQDFHKFYFRKKDVPAVFGESVLAVAMLAYFFYRSAWAVIPLSGVGIFYYFNRMKEKREAYKEELTVQFKECILSVTTSLKAGYAAENAFLESRTDMKMLFGENSMIYRELEQIRRGMVLNITLEELLTELAKRSENDEIGQFAQIFAIAKRNGGNLPEIIRTSAELISRRIETKQEIGTILSGKKMEQNIMKIVPFGILLYIGVSYPGYFDSLYHNPQGIGIMTACLSIYLAAYVLGEKILKKIEKNMM